MKGGCRRQGDSPSAGASPRPTFTFAVGKHIAVRSTISLAAGKSRYAVGVISLVRKDNFPALPCLPLWGKGDRLRWMRCNKIAFGERILSSPTTAARRSCISGGGTPPLRLQHNKIRNANRHSFLLSLSLRELRCATASSAFPLPTFHQIW